MKNVLLLLGQVKQLLLIYSTCFVVTHPVESSCVCYSLCTTIINAIILQIIGKNANIWWVDKCFRILKGYFYACLVDLISV